MTRRNIFAALALGALGAMGLAFGASSMQAQPRDCGCGTCCCPQCDCCDDCGPCEEPCGKSCPAPAAESR